MNLENESVELNLIMTDYMKSHNWNNPEIISHLFAFITIILRSKDFTDQQVYDLLMELVKKIRQERE